MTDRYTCAMGASVITILSVDENPRHSTRCNYRGDDRT